MLRFLTIRHLAVIDRLELEFEPGVNVLTGETGAGKSILVGAIGLLVGGRASPDMIRTGEDTAVIEAVFDAPEGREIILRREISAQGRSRAFIDGSLATSSALRELSQVLVDLHGQHEHQLLLDPSSHLDVLDRFAGVDALRTEVAQAFANWQHAREERDRYQAAARETAARSEFIAFQLAEIDRVAPNPGEDDELTVARQILGNADKLQRLCTEAYDALYEGEHAALPTLTGVWRRISDLATIDDRFTPYIDSRDTIKPQLDDLAFFLRSYSAGIDASPERLQDVEDRLAALERLKKKHGPSLADVIARAARLRSDLDDIQHSGERGAALDAALDRARAEFLRWASALSKQRHVSASKLAGALEGSLEELSMPRTRCEVRLPAAPSEAEWTARGLEQAELYISPNPGEDLRPLARIASGGELSRVMLALKALATTDAPGKTLIFDEVDAGIGGAVADVVGGRLRRLGEKFQVLCITHLPQIAAYGATHFHISKSVRHGRTLTAVQRLNQTERENEIGRMIGGSAVSAAVRMSAREMLEARGARAKGEQKTKGESERDVPKVSD